RDALDGVDELPEVRLAPGPGEELPEPLDGRGGLLLADHHDLEAREGDAPEVDLQRGGLHLLDPRLLLADPRGPLLGRGALAERARLVGDPDLLHDRGDLLGLVEGPEVPDLGVALVSLEHLVGLALELRVPSLDRGHVRRVRELLAQRLLPDRDGRRATEGLVAPAQRLLSVPRLGGGREELVELLAEGLHLVEDGLVLRPQGRVAVDGLGRLHEADSVDPVLDVRVLSDVHSCLLGPHGLVTGGVPGGPRPVTAGPSRGTAYGVAQAPAATVALSHARWTPRGTTRLMKPVRSVGFWGLSVMTWYPSTSSSAAHAAS